MKVLVTGASGFVGREMVRQLSRQDDLHITALTRDARSCPVNTETVTWVSANITDEEAILRTVSRVIPDTVIHLAALNQGSLRDLFRTNVIGTSILLEAVIQADPACRIVVISSSAVYGYAGEAPIDEDIPCAPLSLYGVSKVAEEHTAMMFYHTRGADVAIVRPFNLVGPRLPTTLVCGHIIEQVLAVDQKGDNLIELAESVSRRDFVDVRDLVRGIRALATLPDFHGRCAGKALNIGSGRSVSMEEVIDLIGIIRGKKYTIRLPVIPVPVPVPSQRSDNTRMQALTGWQPEIPLADSLQDMYTAARKQTG